MGNRTSKSRSSAQIKKKYFKVVEKSKREYTQRKNTFLVKLPNHDWRKSVYKDLDALENYMPDMQWPAAIRKMLVSWDILRDQRWRSNIIWFDYLNMNKVSPALPQTTSICSLERPLPSITKNELECQSFLEFFGMHLASPDTHAIAAMIIIFQREFTDTYIDKNCDTSEEPGFHITKRIQTEADVKKMIEEVHLVIDLCVESFQVYYGGIDLQTLMSERYREMRDLVTEKVLSPEVHEVLLQACSQADLTREIEVSSKLDLYCDLTTADLGIESEFCIDAPRYEGQRDVGYGKAILRLKDLGRICNPMQKLQCIMDTTRRICECIDDYWKSDSEISPKRLVISADQILSIFIHVVLKAKIKNLNSHVRLINEFVRDEILFGNSGYYTSTVAASLEHILLLDESMLRKLKGLEEF